MIDGTTATTSGSGELSFSDIFAVLFRRKWMIIGTLIVCFLLGLSLSFNPRKYVAEGVLRVQPGSSSMYRTSQINSFTAETDKTASEVAILQSRTLYLKVAKGLGLENNADFWGVKSLKHQSLDDPAVKEKMVRLMREKILITHKAKDEIITITCSTVSPALSAKIVNTLINDYIEYLFEVRYGSSTRASGWLIGQLDDLKQQVERDQAGLSELQAKLGIVGFTENGNNALVTDSLTSLSKASSEATVARIVAEAKYRFLGESDPNLIEGEVNLLNGSSAAGTGTNGLLQTLRTSQATQASNYARLLAQFGPNYPDVKQVKSQLDETAAQVKAEQTRILNQSRLSYSAASANESMTEKALADKKDQALGHRGDMGKYVILLHDYESHRTLYEGLVTRLKEAGITSGMEGGEIDIVDLADLPTIPAPPGPLSFLLGSIVIGLVLGCLFAFIREALDTRITTPEQAGRATTFPLLSLLPHYRASSNTDAKGNALIVAMASPNAPYSEGIESLRTSIMSATPGESPKVVLITSSFMGEGKSTISINLAAVLARHNSRVLLIDCDLRRSTLAAKLQLKSDVGLSNVLSRRATLEQALQSVPSVNGLHVLVGGLRPPAVTALLDSEEMKELIALCKERFDYVVLDCPPTLGISDVPNLGRLAEAVVLVIRNKIVTRKAIKRTGDILTAARLPIAGYVLNDVDLSSQGYGANYESFYNAYFKDTEEAL